MFDPRASVSGSPAKCQFCCDSGWTGWHKPMSGKDGRTVMVYVPQTCFCEAGDNFRNCQEVVDAT